MFYLRIIETIVIINLFFCLVDVIRPSGLKARIKAFKLSKIEGVNLKQSLIDYRCLFNLIISLFFWLVISILVL